MTPLCWKAAATPASRYGLQYLGFFSAAMIPMGLWMYAVRDPASVALAQRRAANRVAWNK